MRIFKSRIIQMEVNGTSQKYLLPDELRDLDEPSKKISADEIASNPEKYADLLARIVELDEQHQILKPIK
jgi:hypothetical protein